MKKKGISLIVLIITITLMIILVGITIVGISNGVQNARTTSFSNDLVSIEDAIEVYYIQNGNFPNLEENGKYIEYVYSDDKLISNAGESIDLNSGFLTEFREELIQNLDLSEGEDVVSNTVFYKIDLAKLGVENIRRGTGEDGENDIYVMAYPSQTVYYVKGLKVDDKIYFSTINILDINKNELINDEVTAQTIENITVTKSKKAWTNKLGINITANLEENEKIYVKLPVRDTEIELSTTTGENNITINSLSGSLNMTEEEVNNFNNLHAIRKVMNVIKRTDGVATTNIEVDIANYETEIPTFPLKEDGETFDFSITSNDGYNEVSFVGSDNISGIKEVRYVYLTEFKQNLSIKTLYSDTSILTSDYMLQNGKKAYVSGTGKVTINIPKDIEAIYITMYDKAGNSVSMQKNVQTDTYIGINAINISNNLTFDIAILSNSEIASAKAWISLNGSDFIDEKELTLTEVTDNTYESTVEFENKQDKEVYIKVATYDNSETPVEEVRIKKFDLEEVATKLVSLAIPGVTYEENRWYTDKNGDTAIVPAGFRVSTETDEQIINDGLVIIDKNDNEFVWIPCTTDENDTTKVLYTKRFEEYPKAENVTLVADSTTSPVEDETVQITKYGGFYIGRYEAGIPEAMETATNEMGTPTVQKGSTVWNYIDYTNANSSAKLLYNADSIKSGLLTGTMWDTMCAWIGSSGVEIIQSSLYGNYYDTTFTYINADGVETTKAANTRVVIPTGSAEYTKVNNIYDVAGNLYEWTSEIGTSENLIVAHGSSHYHSCYVEPITIRGIFSSAHNDYYIGFRIALFIM